MAIIAFMALFTVVSRGVLARRRIDATKGFLFFQLAFDALSCEPSVSFLETPGRAT
jgi:hypothetical protein